MAGPFKGMGNLGGAGMQKMLENMQKKMLEDAEKMEQRLEAARLDGSSGGGMVKASVTGKGDLLEIAIAPDVVDPADVEMLQDLVVTAVREALDKARALQEDEQKKLMPANIPGLNLPGMF